MIVNVCSSKKLNNELQGVYATKLIPLITNDEIKIRMKVDQINIFTQISNK